MIALLGILVNNLWEGAAIALAAWLVLRLARDVNATTRYVVWTCALAATVVLPVFTTFAVTRGQETKTSSSAPTAVYSAPVLRVTGTKTAPFVSPAKNTPVTPDSGVTSPSNRVVVVPQWLVWSALGIWSLVGIWQVVRFIFGVVALERLKRNATPLPIEYRQDLPRWNAAEDVRAGVRLCVSDEITVPIAVGLFDAMILIPQALLEQLPHDDVDRILLHELTHLRRRDDWIHAFQRLVSALCFFNPAVTFIARQMDLEREVSCDDSVVERDGLHPVPYATCLTKMAEIASWPYRPMAAPGVFDTRRSLSIRVERLLKSARNNRTSFAAAPALMAVMVMSAAGIAGAAVSSHFTFALPVFCDAQETSTLADAYAPGALSLPWERLKVNTPPTKPTTAVKHSAPATKPAIQTKPTVQTKPAIKTQATATAIKVFQTSEVRVARKPAMKVRVFAQLATKPAILAVTNQPSEDPSRDYIQELADAGYRGLTLNELLELRSVGVDAAYIRAIEAAGFPHPSPRELVETRASGVTPSVITDLRRRFGSLSLRDIVELHAVGVTSDYVDSLSRAGYQNLRARDVLELRAVGVTPENIAALRNRLHDVSLRQLGELRAVGVDPDYIDSLSRAGYSGLSAEQLEQLRSLGIDADYIKKVHAHGFNNVTVQQLIEMKATGLL